MVLCFTATDHRTVLCFSRPRVCRLALERMNAEHTAILRCLWPRSKGLITGVEQPLGEIVAFLGAGGMGEVYRAETVAQLGRAPESHSGGRRFDPDQLHQ